MSKVRFKDIVLKAVTKIAFTYLVTEKNKLKKVSHINFTELKTQEYLEPNKTSVKMAKFIFHARNRMLDFKLNYKNKNYGDLLCPVCQDPTSSDGQEHLLQCVKLKGSLVVQDDVKYEDLFSTSVKKQIIIASIMEEKFEKRKTILNLPK